MLNLGKPIIFSTLNYGRLRSKMEEGGDFERGVLVRNPHKTGQPLLHRPFTDGEHYSRVDCDVRDRECVIVGGSIDDSETMDLFDLGCTLFDCRAARLKFVVPFYGYSTMERAVKPGEAVRAKHRARLFSAIPRAPLGNSFFFLDLHTSGLPFYLEGNNQVCHIYAKSMVSRVAPELTAEYVVGTRALAPDLSTGSPASHSSSSPSSFASSNSNLNELLSSFVLCTADANRLKWISSLAKELKVPAAFAYKSRASENVESLGISGDVSGKVVIIFDDMIRTGSSIIAAAKAYLAAGASAIYVISTHGVLPKQALQNIKATGLFKKIVVSDSHPRAERLGRRFKDFLQVETVAPLLVDHVMDRAPLIA